MTSVPQEPTIEDSNNSTLWEKPPGGTPKEVKQLLDTGIVFQGERLLLETDSQETLDAFKAAYHRLERHILGDYGN